MIKIRVVTVVTVFILFLDFTLLDSQASNDDVVSNFFDINQNGAEGGVFEAFSAPASGDVGRHQPADASDGMFEAFSAQAPSSIGWNNSNETETYEVAKAALLDKLASIGWNNSNETETEFPKITKMIDYAVAYEPVVLLDAPLKAVTITLNRTAYRADSNETAWHYYPFGLKNCSNIPRPQILLTPSKLSFTESYWKSKRGKRVTISIYNPPLCHIKEATIKLIKPEGWDFVPDVEHQLVQLGLNKPNFRL